MTAVLLLPGIQDDVLIVAAFAAFSVFVGIVDLRLDLARERENGAKRQFWFDKYLALSREVEAYDENERREDDRVWLHVKRRLRVQPSPVAFHIEASSPSAAVWGVIEATRTKP